MLVMLGYPAGGGKSRVGRPPGDFVHGVGWDP